MFSFRTTPLDQQQDLVLSRGRLAVLCNQSAWNPEKGEYLFETLYRTGKLEKVFYLSEGIFGEKISSYAPLGMVGCRFLPLDEHELEGIDALIIEYQDTGTRYDSFTLRLFDLFQYIHDNKLEISLYILDRENPCGRQVEGTISGVAHRHGLTLGELANLFYSEIGARFPLHIISYMVRSATQYMMPWSIPPYEDYPGLFTSNFICGMKLFTGTNISYGEGTTRPYECFGAPFLDEIVASNDLQALGDPGVFMRRTTFVPKYGLYAGQTCWGFHMLPRPGVPYHSVAHALRILRFIKERTPLADTSWFGALAVDEKMSEFVEGNLSWEDLKEHIKVEEQKWMRKAKRYMLYDEQLSRVKTLV